MLTSRGVSEWRDYFYGREKFIDHRFPLSLIACRSPLLGVFDPACFKGAGEGMARGGYRKIDERTG